jgi:hypothetical protein
MSDIQFKYRHDFAVWAGARASQRGFTTVEILKDALETSGVMLFASNPNIISNQVEFEKAHLIWCQNICKFLDNKDISNVSFGRAAKLIAVYLKSMVVIPNMDSPQASFIHPPVDRILLQNLSKLNKIPRDHQMLLSRSSWTKFNLTEYIKIIAIIDTYLNGKPLWQIEEYWTVAA